MLKDVNENPLVALERRVSALEGAPRLESSSVTDGQMRFIRGTLKIEDGVLDVEGTLDASGEVKITGVVRQSGDTHMTGTQFIENGGRLSVSSGTDHTARSLQIYQDEWSRLVAFNTPLQLLAWASQIIMLENALGLAHGDGTQIVLATDVIAMIRGGARIMVEDNKVTIAARSGPPIEIRDGSIYMPGLPTS